jgi:hypothetical protein
LGKELLGALMSQDIQLVLCTVPDGNVQEAFWRGHASTWWSHADWFTTQETTL